MGFHEIGDKTHHFCLDAMKGMGCSRMAGVPAFILPTGKNPDLNEPRIDKLLGDDLGPLGGSPAATVFLVSNQERRCIYTGQFQIGY